MSTKINQHPTQVILGVDGSPDCLAGIDLLCSLPCLPACTILALSVVAGNHSTERSQMEAALRQAQERLQGCCAIETALVEGHPAEVLVRTARDRQADLIVIGARGQRAVLDFLMGGVAQQVVEHAECPVLVARSAGGRDGSPPRMTVQNVLLALDGSPCSHLALEYTAAFALPEKTQLIVAGVAPPAGLPAMSVGSWPVGQELVPMLSDRELAELEVLRKGERLRMQALLDAARDQLLETGRSAVSTLLEGDPAEALLKYTASQSIHLVIAGSRGLSAIRGWLIGSVSRKLVLYAPVSVLIVKGRAACDEQLVVEDG